MTYLITFIVAVCSILYELILAQSLSILMGNTVLRYSVTIGLYLFSLGLGALLCERWGWSQGNVRRRLVHVELLLGLGGGIAVLYLALATIGERMTHLYLAYHIAEPGSLYHMLFLAVLHAPVIFIGLLSGCEIPLLVAQKTIEQPHTNHLNHILAIDYFGSLAGSLAFPLYLLPQWGLYATAFATALLNASACLALSYFYRPILQRQTLAALLVMVMMAIGVTHSQAIQQAMLRYYYYFFSIYQPTLDLLRPLKVGDDIEEIPSLYQSIALIPYGSLIDPNVINDNLGIKFTVEPDFPRYWVMRLNRRTQWSSNLEEYYHEPFAHIPIQIRGAVPQRVLILGGGDGLLARELLKYRQIKQIVQVEIDPAMINLARHHPVLLAMNHDSLDDPRVTVIQQGAMIYLSEYQEKFDAIYADFPAPVDFDLSRLFSVTFFSLMQRHLNDSGYAIIDIPYSPASAEWSIVSATAYAAGWHDILPFGEPETGESFLLGWAQQDKGHEAKSWVDWGIPLYTLNAISMAKLFEYGANIGLKIDADATVNTLDQPQLPVIAQTGFAIHW